MATTTPTRSSSRWREPRLAATYRRTATPWPGGCYSWQFADTGRWVKRYDAGCRDASARRRVGVFRDLTCGASVERVLRTAGQPHARLDDAFTYCANTRTDPRVKVRAVFSDRGHLRRIRLP